MELITQVIKRLTEVRRWNFALSLLAPVLLILLAFLFYRFESSFSWFSIPVICFCLVVSGWFLFVSWRLLSPTSPEEAATIIDTKVSGKDRFLTIASLSATTQSKEREDALSAVNIQAQELSHNFGIKAELPFILERTAKFSLIASPFLIGLLALLLLRYTPHTTPITLIDEKMAKELRALANKLELLPTNTKNSLLELAELAEEDGIYSNDFQQALDEAFQKIEKESSSLDKKSDEPKNEQKEPQQEKEKNQQKEPASKSEEEHTSNDSSNKKDETKEEKQNKETGSKKESEKDPQSGSEKEKKSPEQGPDGEKKEEGEEGSKDNSAPENENQNEGEQGEGKNKADEKYQGEGSSEEGEQGGKGKDGSAQHDAKDQSQPGGTGQQQDSGNEGKENSQLAQVKDKLSEIKNEVEKKKTNGSPSADGNKEEGEQNGTKGEEKENKEGSANNTGTKKDNSSPGKEQEEKEGTGGEEEKNSLDSKSEPSGEEAEKSPLGDSKEGDKELPKEQLGKGESPQSKGGAKPQEKEGEKQGKDTIAKSDRPDKIPEANDRAPRLGPFDGGDEGSLSGGERTLTRIDVPLEEKIVVRGVGESDQKRYKNPNEAQAKTALGSEEFKKPEADLSQTKQPIPVEYRDILR